MYRVEVPIQQAVDLTLFCFSSWETCTFGRLGEPCPNLSRVRWWVAIPPRVNPISLQKCCTNWLSGCSRVCRSKTSMSHFYSPKSFFFVIPSSYLSSPSAEIKCVHQNIWFMWDHGLEQGLSEDQVSSLLAELYPQSPWSFVKESHLPPSSACHVPEYNCCP